MTEKDNSSIFFFFLLKVGVKSWGEGLIYIFKILFSSIKEKTFEHEYLFSIYFI